MANILPAVISGLIGTVLSIVVTVILFSKQSRSETNRIYLDSMFDIMRKMYILTQKNEEIPEDLSSNLRSLKVIGLKNFEPIRMIIDELNKLVDGYNKGVRESINSTTSGQIAQKEELEKKLNEATEKLYKLT